MIYLLMMFKRGKDKLDKVDICLTFSNYYAVKISQLTSNKKFLYLLYSKILSRSTSYISSQTLT